MTFVPAPEPEPEQHLRTWGAVCGTQHYRVDVIVQRNVSEHPPQWMRFDFADAPNDGVLTPENFIAAAGPHVAQRGCEVLEAELHPVSAEEYYSLAMAQVA